MPRALAPWISTFEFALVYGLFALSTFAALWSGVLSLASVSFGAVAGFTAAYVTVELGWPFLPTLLVGGLIGTAMALLVSIAFLRLSSHYLAMATIALVLITRVFVLNLGDVTGGASGRGLTRSMELWGLLLIVALSGYVFSRLRRSRLGLATEAVREDPDVAASLGIDPISVQRKLFALSGFVGGVAGVLFADLLRFIGPNTYYVDLAFVMLASVVLGGAYHWGGAFAGALVFTALPEILRQFFTQGTQIANGVMLIIIMIYLPRGVVDPARRRARVGAEPDPPLPPARDRAESRADA